MTGALVALCALCFAWGCVATSVAIAHNLRADAADAYTRLTRAALEADLDRTENNCAVEVEAANQRTLQTRADLERDLDRFEVKFATWLHSELSTLRPVAVAAPPAGPPLEYRQDPFGFIVEDFDPTTEPPPSSL